jgi:hypothetical protein
MNNNIKLIKIKLSIGDEFSHRFHPNCRFIKVTKKGFNVVDLDTHRCLLPRNIFMLKMAGKSFPRKGDISGMFLVPAHYFEKLTKKERI